MSNWTVIGVYESTGKVFAMLVEGSEDCHDAMRAASRDAENPDDLQIVGAVLGAQRVEPPCEESGNIAYAVDLADIKKS